jgi:DnaJ-class molecular chaperone
MSASRSEGSNLRLRLPIDLEDAVLGAKVRVPTLGGTVEMAIPPMTSSGRTFRLRGRGLSDKTGAGDLLVTAEIKLPEGSDEALIEVRPARREAKVG